MAPSADNWLASRLEQEVQAVIEWRTRQLNPTHIHSMVIDERNYVYDGSNLWGGVEYINEDPVLIQVQQFTKNKRPFNCVVSDGFTTVRAKFTSKASQTLQELAEIDNLAKLSNQVVLNIPKFRVMVAPSGLEEDRVQILIDYVGIVKSRRVDTLGNPVPFHSRPGVSQLLNQVEHLMRPVSEPEAPEVAPNPGRTRVVKDGQYTQEFATQVRPSLHGAGFEMLDGANLAPPVVPHRNDGAKVFGTIKPSRANNQNAYDDLIQLMPGVVTNKTNTSAIVSTMQPFASQPPSQINLGFTHHDSNNRDQSDMGNSSGAIVDLTGSNSSMSSSPEGPQFAGAIEDAIENVNNHLHGTPYHHAMDVHEMMVHVGGVDFPAPVTAHQPVPIRLHNERGSVVPTTKDRDTSQPRTPTHREASPTPPNKKSLQKCRSRSWTNILMHASRRAEFVCPSDQDMLLIKDESEYHPMPGRVFPSANIPIELFTQLHELPSVHPQGFDMEMEEDLSDEEDVDGEGEAPVGQDEEDEEDEDKIIAEWSQTPEPGPNLDDELPPESSPPPQVPPRSPNSSKIRPVRKNAMWNDPQFTTGQRENVTGEPLMTPLDHEMNVDYPPKAIDTARMFSSAVRPEIIVQEVQHEPKNSNDSLETLSSGVFKNPSSSLLQGTRRLSVEGQGSQSIRSSSGVPASGQGSWKGTQSTPSSNNFSGSGQGSALRTQLPPNTIHESLSELPLDKFPESTRQILPGTQELPQENEQSENTFSGKNILNIARTMRPPPPRVVSTGGHLDGADSDMPSEVTDAMAEQQLLHDLQAAAHHSSDEVQAPSTPARFSDGRSSQRNSPKSVAATSLKRREAPEMSPQELRGPKVSRFNFTQESPVSQDPALAVVKARKEFLEAKKNSKQPIEQEPEVASSPLRVEPAPVSVPDVNMADDEVEDEVEDTSLYGEFRRAYPSYKGSVVHFEKYCKSLAASCKKGQLLCHPILWDDFIARSDSDYVAYTVEQIRQGAQTVDPYEKYYNEQIEGSMHEKKVVTRAKLEEWFGQKALQPPDRVESRAPKRPRKFERAGFAQQASTANMAISESAPIKQENQGTEKVSPWVTAGKVSKGAEWWRKP